MKNKERFIRPLTRNLVEALLLDVWPSSATCMDFGIESADHLGALQYAYREDGVPLEQLDAAMGNGSRLQQLITETNPYRFVSFRTIWDDLPSPDEVPFVEEKDA